MRRSKITLRNGKEVWTETEAESIMALIKWKNQKIGRFIRVQSPTGKTIYINADEIILIELISHSDA